MCGRGPCRTRDGKNHPKWLGEQLEKAKQDAMDKPLPTLAERQARAAELEPLAIEYLRLKAMAGDSSAAAKLLDYSARLLDASSPESEDWLAESPSEATDSR
jgi:hypothetical protein